MTTSRGVEHVWVVNRTEDFDGIYVFADEHQARDFAACHTDAVVSEEILMNRSAAAQFLIDMAEDDR